MYAIVDIAGQQMKVQKDQKLYVHRLKGDEGSQVEFGKVLLVDNEGSISVGRPMVEGVSVTAQILAHVKGDKVLIFKKKRRKGYQKLNGHRQYFSQILIEEISFGGEKRNDIPPATFEEPEEPVYTASPVEEDNTSSEI
ncbi:MAG: 50S ribosomal protein L21 [Bacteroidetes bacterium]|nr:50S ribosomal protein L21 [Bacteroidota bacterium]